MDALLGDQKARPIMLKGFESVRGEYFQEREESAN